MPFNNPRQKDAIKRKTRQETSSLLRVSLETRYRRTIDALREAVRSEKEKNASLEATLAREEVRRKILESKLTLQRKYTAKQEAFAREAQMFLLGLTNTMTLAGRGWIETMRRIEEQFESSTASKKEDRTFRWTDNKWTATKKDAETGGEVPEDFAIAESDE